MAQIQMLEPEKTGVTVENGKNMSPAKQFAQHFFFLEKRKPVLKEKMPLKKINAWCESTKGLKKERESRGQEETTVSFGKALRKGFRM